jgi:hypothetical protein
MFSRLIGLVATVSLKFLSIIPVAPATMDQVIVDFLHNNQFAAWITDTRIEYLSVIEASSDRCHLWVSRISPLGFEKDIAPSIGAATNHLAFIFRGSVYESQPIALTSINYLWFRFLRELHLVPHIPPVLAVVSSCDARILPWRELGL